MLGFAQHSRKGRGGVLIPGGCWLPAKVPTKNWRRSLRGSRGGGGGRLVPPRECARAKGGREKEKAGGECTLKKIVGLKQVNM